MLFLSHIISMLFQILTQTINSKFISESFNHNNLIVIDNHKKFEEKVLSYDLSNSVLLMMSSGKFGGFNFARESLSLIDNLERAIISYKSDESLKSENSLDKIINGIEIVKKDLISIFKKNSSNKYWKT